MNQEKILSELESLVQSIGMTIRYEKGDFKGGDCILYDQNLVVLNKKMTNQQKISILSRVIGFYGSEDLYMKPYLRQIVDDEMTRLEEQLRTFHSNQLNENNEDSNR